jgi:hypothetical protein
MRYLILILFVAASAIADAQSKWTEYSAEDGLIVSYKWSKIRPKKKDQTPELQIMVMNSNAYTVNYTLAVEVFINGKLNLQSPPATYCILPGKTKKGKINGHYFRIEVPKDIIGDPKFTLELGDLEVTQTNPC